ncbi:universal stress protein [Conexibacter sp. SYSU D00693]|uniref:universal stress protein n=1 Tax=Conexibacter sp. SYSU D00693 TaxID=2812560 RepID=UPI00196A7AC1|nr:universal stress protein [Conexibacter sp. SYSU D00693]
MHHTIVVAGSRPGPLRDAFALAAELARPRGARIVLAHVDVGLDPESPLLEELRASAPRDLRVETRVVLATSVVRGLVRVAEEEDADVLVLGPSELSAVRRVLQGDVATDALRQVPCPLAWAPSGYAAHAQRPRRVAVAWAPTPEAGEALEWAVQLAERTAADLQVVHVADDGEEPEELDRLRREASRRVPTTTRVVEGDPVVELREGVPCDLLVLGSRAQSPLRRVTLGSVSATVLHHSRCPVVVVPRGVHAPAETAV